MQTAVFDAYLSSSDFAQQDADILRAFGVTHALLLDDLDGQGQTAEAIDGLTLYRGHTLSILGNDARTFRERIDELRSVDASALFLRVGRTTIHNDPASVLDALHTCQAICGERGWPLLLDLPGASSEVQAQLLDAALHSDVAPWLMTRRLEELESRLRHGLNTILIVAPRAFTHADSAHHLAQLATAYPGRIALGSGPTGHGRNPWALPSTLVALDRTSDTRAASGAQTRLFADSELLRQLRHETSNP